MTDIEIRYIIEDDRKCPRCKGKLNGNRNVNADAGFAPPTEGDFTVCAHCGTILIFQKDLSLREASIKELQAFEEEDIVAYRQLDNTSLFYKREASRRN